MKKAFHTFELKTRKVTLAVVTEGSYTRVGYSVCMPEDKFNETMARRISEGRALSKNNLKTYFFSHHTNYELSENYSILKQIAIIWENKIKEHPTHYIKGIK